MSKNSKIIFWIAISLVFTLGIISCALDNYLTKDDLPAADNIIDINDDEITAPSCEDKCGDKICQQIECVTASCPCTESNITCPQDCPNNDGLTFQTEKIEEENSEYTIDISYPIIEMEDENGADIINEKIKAIIDNQIKNFKASAVYKEPEMAVSYLENYFDFFLLNENFISLNFSFTNYASGAAHPNNYSIPFNYEVASHREIFLDDLFKSEPNYLDYFADYCQLILKYELGSDLFIEGLSPVKDNYNKFVLTKESMVIIFDPYQVAAYAYGPQHAEIYYYELTDVIDENGPIPRLLGQETWGNIINRN